MVTIVSSSARSVGHDSLEAHGTRGGAFVGIGDPLFREDLDHRFHFAARHNLERFGEKAAESRAAFDSEGGWTGILKVYAEIAAA